MEGSKQWMCVQWRDGQKSIVDIEALVADPDSPAPRNGWDIIVKKDGVDTPATFLTKSSDYVMCQYIVGDLPAIIPCSPRREEESPTGSRATNTVDNTDAVASTASVSSVRPAEHVANRKVPKKIKKPNIVVSKRPSVKKRTYSNGMSQEKQKRPKPTNAGQAENPTRASTATNTPHIPRALISTLFHTIFAMYRFVEAM